VARGKEQCIIERRGEFDQCSPEAVNIAMAR
jgi:hypothetical protein